MNPLTRSARKITHTLFTALSLSSAGFIAMITLIAIVGAKLMDHNGWAGIPNAIYLLGGALSAYLWGYLMDVVGRRVGLTTGVLIGVLGAGMAVWAIQVNSWLLFLMGMVLVGAANSAVILGRFVAAEVNPPQSRGRAISIVLLGGTVGAVFGPLLVSPTSQLGKTFGFEEFTGVFIVGAILLLITATIVFILLRPEPRELGRRISEIYSSDSGDIGIKRTFPQVLRQPAAAIAVSSMVMGQVVMVSLMTIVSLHMRGHQHGLGSISIVFAAHSVGMYAFSIISGRLTDRWGRGHVIAFGAGTLVLSCLIASVSTEVVALSISLFLLGLGWNFSFVGGSTLLADQLSPGERARNQGSNDLLVGVVSALGSFGSGLVFSALGFESLARFSALIALSLLIMVLIWMRRVSYNVLEAAACS